MPSAHMEGEKAKAMRGKEKGQAEALNVIALKVKTSQEPVVGTDPLLKAVRV